MNKYLFVLFLALVFNLNGGKAQTPLTTYTVIGTGTLANCAPVVTGQTQFCFPIDGLAVSVKGAAYVLVPLSTSTAGVTSWNGLTGAVTYTPPAAPVTSVNGKTGAVTIAATTTSTTTSSTTLQ